MAKVLILHSTTIVMMSSKTIPVRIGRDTVEELKKLKIHPRETYDDVIKRLIKNGKNKTHS